MALISSETGVSTTPSNAEERQCKDLTKRILRFFASGGLRLKKSRNSPNTGFRMERNTISTANGNVSILNVHNYNGGACNIQNSGTPLNDLDSMTVARPKFLHKLPQFSTWDIHTEERVADTGVCRVYTAKVNGKRALVKEFYGKDATKAWVATARLHAATHLAPEFLRLMGTSGTQGAEDGGDVGLRPCLLLEWDDLQPWKLESGDQVDHPCMAEDLIRDVYLFHDIMNIIVYLMDLSLPTFVTTQDVELYQRPVKYRNVSCAQPILAFNCSGSDGHLSEVANLSAHEIFRALANLGEDSRTEKISPTRCLLFDIRLSAAEAQALRHKYGFNELVYPNALVKRYINHDNAATLVFCAYTISCRPSSKTSLLDELKHRGTITQQEWEELMESLGSTGDSRNEEGSDSDGEFNDD